MASSATWWDAKPTVLLCQCWRSQRNIGINSTSHILRRNARKDQRLHLNFRINSLGIPKQACKAVSRIISASSCSAYHCYIISSPLPRFYIVLNKFIHAIPFSLCMDLWLICIHSGCGRYYIGRCQNPENWAPWKGALFNFKVPKLSHILGKWYVVKHNCVIWGVFNDHIMNNYMFRHVLAIFRLS